MRKSLHAFIAINADPVIVKSFQSKRNGNERFRQRDDRLDPSNSHIQLIPLVRLGTSHRSLLSIVECSPLALDITTLGALNCWDRLFQTVQLTPLTPPLPVVHCRVSSFPF